ncbi:MAG: hypothetical protein HQL78_07190 [Magnetococcales bacterium]|nr:hypothetical protein [Magnetococcales bacterium]
MKWYESLRFKIVLVILASMLAVGFVFSYQSYHEARDAMERESAKTAQVFQDIVKKPDSGAQQRPIFGFGIIAE